MKVRELFEETIEGGKTVLYLDIDEDGHFIFDYSDKILSGSFICTDEGSLKSLKGCPMEVNQFCTFSGCENISSLEESPKKVGTWFSIKYCPKITSLKGIGKDYLLEIGTKIILPSTLKSNILSLPKIRKLQNIEIVGSFSSATGGLLDAIGIINKHLPDRNLRKCKSELEETGLSNYAKL